MTNETTENFLKVMAEFEWPDPIVVTYRLYYNDDGSPKCYTMDDLPGKYVEVDREIFVTSPYNVKVVDGQVKIVPPNITVSKLQPNSITGTPCHVGDVTIVVDTNQHHTKWNMNFYETN